MRSLILVSGSGIGAGKSTLARRLGAVVSLADTLRYELAQELPQYDWFNRSQAYKRTPVPEYGAGQLTLREVMIQHGQLRCADNPTYWVDRAADLIDARIDPVIAVDDVRKVLEVQVLRGRFGHQVVHLHLNTASGIYEPEFENDKLLDLADYVITSQRPLDPGALQAATALAASSGATRSGTPVG